MYDAIDRYASVIHPEAASEAGFGLDVGAGRLVGSLPALPKFGGPRPASEPSPQPGQYIFDAGVVRHRLQPGLSGAGEPRPQQDPGVGLC